MSRGMLIAAAVAACAALPQGAAAQFHKAKTITMIVNYPAGGPTDIEGRIVALHLPDHLPGHPTVVVKNIGGGSGLLGANVLGDAAANGETIGFLTAQMVQFILGDPGIRTHLSDFVFVGGVASPQVTYVRRDTPPGINVGADLIRAKDFKALSLNASSENTLSQTLALDMLGLEYQPVPAYIGLKEVETAILQNVGQVANSSLSGWSGSVEPAMGGLVIPLWQLTPRDAEGAYKRSRALPGVPTFEEFYANVTKGKTLSEDFRYAVMRAVVDPQLAMFRVLALPPKTPADVAATMRSAFNDLWNDPQFLADYSKVIHTEPILVPATECERLAAELGSFRPEIKKFMVDYIDRMTSK